MKKPAGKKESKVKIAKDVAPVVVASPVNKKRKAVEEEADTGHVSKKANVEGVAVATSAGMNSAKKQKLGSAQKTVGLLI